ncbi:MAG TPA: hypothetical protein PKV80_28995, partial [Leptospiraceae bacterium]|nr:hypothetical protein [Leptospiraceae bacterium]
EAVGGHYKIIEVQSGWKDRQDLIGHYNTFEGKYYESEFLKALYEASCPKYQNRPYFIILDEMNLSHPEHYFADFLSMLEQEEDRRELKVLTHPLPNTPKMIKGNALRIPSNVWFIGTANHDETTVGFAPKTIDRANVMEMPKNYEVFSSEPSVKGNVYISSLYHMFNEPTGKNLTEVEHSLKFLNLKLKPYMEKFGIGWGNRLENQLKKFIPVYIECGGKEPNAVDHIVLNRIFRNLKDRYDIRIDELKKFKDSFEKDFCEDFKVQNNLHSIRFLEEEISKKDSYLDD